MRDALAAVSHRVCSTGYRQICRRWRDEDLGFLKTVAGCVKTTSQPDK